ncbi:1-acyl-sn-glycerol-3-phosphate acyltransferase [Balneolaceae bacterium ANBcel3]|nr:1-acyl-sn-glycerol-3-phosphate acyltransferase [Balneolaceae bacterium ANBcel3]
MLSLYRYTHFSSGRDPIDIDYLNSFYKEVSSPILESYFRAEVHGCDNIPKSGPVILASNHSGNAFPHDSFALDQLLWKHFDFSTKDKIRPLYSPKLAVTWWMRPFGLDNWWRLFGAIDQTYINFVRVLEKGGRVIYYPEGIPGIGKGFNRKYKLQPFQPSFIKLASRHNIPVVPVYGVNAEWINPANLTFKWLNNLSSRWLGIPFIPIPLILLAILFPFFFYFAFPCNMKFFIGKPVSIRELLTKKSTHTTPDNPTKNEATEAAEVIRESMQKELDGLVKTHGNRPYNWKSLLSAFKIRTGKRLLTTPFGWPVLYTRHYRDYFDKKDKRKKTSRLKRDWDLIGYYLPFGWIFLSLARAFRKPPYGNYGLDKHEQIKKEGSYVWSLAKEEKDT